MFGLKYFITSGQFCITTDLRIWEIFLSAFTFEMYQENSYQHEQYLHTQNCTKKALQNLTLQTKSLHLLALSMWYTKSENTEFYLNWFQVKIDHNQNWINESKNDLKIRHNNKYSHQFLCKDILLNCSILSLFDCLFSYVQIDPLNFYQI